MKRDIILKKLFIVLLIIAIIENVSEIITWTKLIIRSINKIKELKDWEIEE